MKTLLEGLYWLSVAAIWVGGILISYELCLRAEMKTLLISAACAASCTVWVYCYFEIRRERAKSPGWMVFGFFNGLLLFALTLLWLIEKSTVIGG